MLAVAGNSISTSGTAVYSYWRARQIVAEAFRQAADIGIGAVHHAVETGAFARCRAEHERAGVPVDIDDVAVAADIDAELEQPAAEQPAEDAAS